VHANELADPAFRGIVRKRKPADHLGLFLTAMLARVNRGLIAFELVCLVPATVVCVVFLYFVISSAASLLGVISGVLYLVALVAHFATFDIGRKYVGGSSLVAVDSARWTSAMLGAAAVLVFLAIRVLSGSSAEGFDIVPYLSAFLVPLAHLGASAFVWRKLDQL